MMSFSKCICDFTAKEELLTLLPMKERLRGRGHFSVVQKLYGENQQLPVCKLCIIDGCLLSQYQSCIMLYKVYSVYV